MTFDPSTDPIEQIFEIASKAVYGSVGNPGTTPADTRFRLEVRHFLDETADIDRALAILIEVGEALGLVTRDGSGQFQARKQKVSTPASSQVAPVPVAGAETDDDGHGMSASKEATVVMPDPSSATTSSDTAAMTEKSVTGGVVSETPSTDRASPPADAATVEVSVEEDEAGSGAAVVAAPAPVSSPSPTSIASRAKSKNAFAAAAIFSFKMGTGREIGSYRFSELDRAERESRADAKIFRRVREYAQPVGDPKIVDYFAADVLAKIVGRRGAPLVAGKKVRRAKTP